MPGDITMEFLRGLDGTGYPEAVDIVRRNSKGKLWLIGSFVYGTLAHILYDSKAPKADFDFVVEKPVLNFVLPQGWKVSMSRFWNPKFTKGDKSIDYVPLENVYSICSRKLKPTIENYLKGVPMTVQSIAFDVNESRIIGDVGIYAVTHKTVRVHNLEFAIYAAQKKNIPLDQMIQRKAAELGFTPQLTPSQ